MKVQFWGTRGSYPVSNKKFTQFGGNTSCVSVHTPNHVFIFDAGTGIIDLGHNLEAEMKKQFILCLSHCHMDHIIGLPHFKPTFDTDFHLKIIASTYQVEGGIQQILTTAFSPPFFPVPWIARECILEYEDIFALAPKMFDDDKVILTAITLDHPGGASGYRLDYENRSVCYITDTGHDPNCFNESLVEFIKKTDLFIYDTTFTQKEFAQHKEWGHSTAEEAIKLAKQADVKRLAMYHHSPDHNDTKLRQIEKAATKNFGHAFCAYDGMKLEI